MQTPTRTTSTLKVKTQERFVFRRWNCGSAALRFLRNPATPVAKWQQALSRELRRPRRVV